MDIVIPIKQKDKRIGEIVFRVTDAKQAMGFVKNISLPNNSALFEYFNTQFETNPNGIAISGGLIVKDIGHYSDGVVFILMEAEKEFGITFDADKMPWPRYPEGAIG